MRQYYLEILKSHSQILWVYLLTLLFIAGERLVSITTPYNVGSQLQITTTGIKTSVYLDIRFLGNKKPACKRVQIFLSVFDSREKRAGMTNHEVW